MTATELMIGDWVCYSKLNGYYTQVKQIKCTTEGDVWYIKGQRDDRDSLKIEFDESFVEDILRPIPLTSEILEKIGFTTKDELGHWTGWRSYGLFDKDKKCLFMLRLYEKDVRCEISLNACPYYIVFRHLHELQHALRLCGINKEIEL